MLILTAGCSWNKIESSAQNELVIGLGASAQTMDPRFTTDATGQRLTNLIFQSLVKVGPDHEITGDAADSWTLDGNNYVFTIEEPPKFHNGKPVSPEDIKYSFDFYQSKKSPFATMFKAIENVIVSKKNNKLVIKLIMNEFSAPFLNDLERIKILPKDEILKDPESFASSPIGSGPFKIKNVTPQEYLLERIDHSPESTKARYLRMKIIRDDNTRFQKLIKGEIDIIQNNLPFDKVHYISKRDDFRVMTAVGPSMTYLLINHRDPILKNLEIRRAIQMSLNIDELITHKHRNYTLPATSILTPGNYFFNSDLMRTNFDPSEAQKLVERQGFKKLNIELKTSSSPSSVENAKVLSFLLKKAGINLKLKSYEWGLYYDDVKNGRFQMALMKWIGAIDPDIYRLTLHSEMTPPGRNRGHYKNVELDKLVDKGVKTKDKSKRKQIYDRVQEIAYGELATIPLWYEKQIYVLGPKIQNFYPPKSGDFSGIAEASLRPPK